MDYLVVGSNGFAQVGRPEFYEKNKIEMKYLLEYLKDNYPILAEFSRMCQYKQKWFSHDFGNYSEIVLIYNNRLLEDWEESDPDRFDRFWDWFNIIESINLESESLSTTIKNMYLESVCIHGDKSIV